MKIRNKTNKDEWNDSKLGSEASNKLKSLIKNRLKAFKALALSTGDDKV